jgi:TolB protein
LNYIKFILLLLTLLSSIAHAILEVNILKTQEDSFPIVIAPFKVGGGADSGAIIANIIRDNLNRSGQFNAISTSKPIINQIDFNY